jgi:predicted Fe-Mo cluster-binding NifX family protein
MRIAISTDGKYVAEHFGRCPIYTVVDIENGEVVQKLELNNPGHTPGLIPQFLNDNQVEQIICGGMGMRAQGFFQEFGIATVMGISGLVDDVIESLKKGTLEGGSSFCQPGAGKGYGIEKDECDHTDE